MKHSSQFFGKYSHLLGTLVCPEIPDLDRPVIISWNAGISSRLGLNQINREFAFEFAKNGFSMLRFDLSGMGDSDQRQDSLMGSEKTTQDILDAIGFLESKGFSKFILLGNCSSAVDAHRVAAIDERIVGLAMIDSYCYPTKEFLARYYGSRIIDVNRWKNAYLKITGKQEKGQSDVSLFDDCYPKQEVVTQDLQRMVNRGVLIHALYTGGIKSEYNYKNQFNDMFPGLDFKNQLDLNFQPNYDHMLSVTAHRSSYIQQIIDWVLKHFSTESLTSSDNYLVSKIQEWERNSSGKTAIVFGEETRSYAWLKESSNKVASFLQERDQGSGDRVGVFMSRSPEMIATIIGIIKSGSCYVPLDKSYPADRIQYMKENAELNLVISDIENSDSIDIHSILKRTEENYKTPEITSQSPAYIIYTSGSTGKPKGVELGHRALSELIDWQLKQSLDSQVTLQFSPISFDVSFQEIFATLCAQGTLVLISEGDRRNPKELLNVMERHHVDRIFLPFVALQMIASSANHYKSWPSHLREVITAGEQLQVNEDLREFFHQCSKASLTNQYGPSESHVVTSLTLEGPVESWPSLPAIGFEIDSADIRIHEPNDKGHGELLISGPCLANGYWKNEIETEKKFVTIDGTRFYRTGDLGYRDNQGKIFFIGRNDDQVKINGFRIELSEVEIALASIPQVKQTVAKALPVGDDLKLVAFYSVTETISESQIREFLARDLPNYMIPQKLVAIEGMPLTPSGKIDRKKLELPDSYEHKSQASTESLEELIQKEMAALLNVSIDLDENFFSSGGSSLLAIRLAQRLEKNLSKDISPADVFDGPTPKALAARILGETNPIGQTPSKSTLNDKIAVIGMAGRFPGAENIVEFWRNLEQGKETGSSFTPEELGLLDDDEGQLVLRKGVVNNSDCFDHEFFKIRPADAALMDPQHRVFIEEAYRAMDDASLVHIEDRNIGVFAGAAHNTYFVNNVLRNQSILDTFGSFQSMLANDKDYLATRVAYHLNLKGPAININTACSTSLVAISQAVDALRLGRCNAAIAGGVHISSPIKSAYTYSEGDIRSPDGLCKPFSKDAQGTYFSDGVGVVVLMPLDKAIENGHRIYSIIEGLGINNDGTGKASFSSPSIQGQAASISAAHQDAGIKPHQVQYVEAHGTATIVGDPIELEALNRVFKTDDQVQKSSVALGSVKSNFGHLTAAAGVAGFIKTSLAMFFEKLPKTLHFDKGNPHINWDDQSFYVQSSTSDWPKESSVKRAGISSFGIGGTNIHLCLKEHHQFKASNSNVSFLAIDSKDLETHKRYIDSLKNQITQPSTLQGINSQEPQLGKRGFAVLDEGEVFSHGFSDNTELQKLAFLFPGQGSQVLEMGTHLLDSWPSFAKYFDECSNYFDSLFSYDLRSALVKSRKSLAETANTQAAIFSISYCLGKALMDEGAKPDLMIGHSIGELAAAAVAEYISLEDAITIVYHRGHLMQNLPSGKMLAVKANWESVQNIIHDDVDLAARNGFQSITISGDNEAIDASKKALENAGIAARELETSHAFHSKQMKGMLTEFREKIETIKFQKGSVNVVSTLNLEPWYFSLPDTDYWLNHILEPVNFYGALDKLSENFTAIEIGSGTVCTNIARREFSSKIDTLPSLGRDAGSKQEWTAILSLLGHLWTLGYISKPQFTQEKGLSLPHPFKRTKHWIEPDSTNSDGINSIQELAEVVSQQPKSDLSDLISTQLDLMKKQLELITDSQQIVSKATVPKTSELKEAESKFLAMTPSGDLQWFLEETEQEGGLLSKKL